MTPFERLLLPENLVYAWRKAKKLYHMADGYIARAEIAAFELNLESELASIRGRFEQGTYKLEKLRPLPRPKKIDGEGKPVNRQYYHVAVRDQVAWIAVVNALGPELDKKMPPWSYGNRLYRPFWYEDTEGRSSKLEVGPYRHASGHLYKKFQHSWPLFRRHVSLTARNMVRQIQHDDLDDKIDQLALASAEKAKLPYISPEFWSQKEKVTSLYYASIDLEKFYPNIETDAVLRAFIDFVPEVNEGDEMVKLLKRMLHFSLDGKGMPSEILQKADPPFRQNVQGIPTGLFVSGFLANVVMLAVDQEVDEKVQQDKTVAHFRFVDDHTLIAYDFDILCQWIDWYKDLLSQKSIGAKINEEKYDPPSLADWVKNPNDQEIKKKAELECQVDGRNPTKLLTKTLGQVSAIAAANVEILADKDLESRLTYLEWLLLADIPEREIRPDTRAAFAAGQIAFLTPLLIQETNGLVEETRKLTLLKAEYDKRRDENDGIAAEIQDRIAKHEEFIKGLKKEHDDNEQRRLRRCFHLLLQAFEEHPSKARLFYRLLQYCRLTGYKGLKSVSGWIDDERARDRVFWADYYSSLTLHLLSHSLLKAVSTLVSTGAMWSDRNAAKSHIEDIASIQSNVFILKKERQTWVHTNAQMEFSVAVLASVAFLKDNDCTPSLLDKLELLASRHSFTSFQMQSSEWYHVTNQRPGVWLQIIEPVLSDGVNPSLVWKRFENCFDYDDVLDRNAARRYPKLLSNRGWNAFLNNGRALDNTDSGWLSEVLFNNEDRREQASSSRRLLFRRVIRAYEACPKSHIKLSEWIQHIRTLRLTHPFDPRHSEWTALEIIRLIIKPVLQYLDEDLSIFELIHPENILLPKEWKLDNSVSFLMSWESWRRFVEEENSVSVVKKHNAILDYRYYANDIKLVGNNKLLDVGLHSIGNLLLELLHNHYCMPPTWNIRGNEHSLPLQFGSIFSTLAVSSKTLKILESCLNARSVENRTIQSTASLFGLVDGEAPNDTQLDPPLLNSPNDLYDAITKAQKVLVENQIAVSENQPRQLIPVQLEGLVVVAKSEEGGNDGE
ncbi:MAG: RNA-directed DNA polymerase [Candidatus Thiodiazotropha lotti]|nr:RNA-directed DNA polymerase [Candidatus Thiodiazotropha lotti]MCW4187978.1 RNA-directed DNA polymerase [Candidatus Thiodiazotropha lotti]